MSDRYFQCAMCKKLTVLDDIDCLVTNKNTAEAKDYNVTTENLVNEVCECTGAKRRLRELNQAQYNMEVALNRDVNN